MSLGPDGIDPREKRRSPCRAASMRPAATPPGSPPNPAADRRPDPGQAAALSDSSSRVLTVSEFFHPPVRLPGCRQHACRPVAHIPPPRHALPSCHPPVAVGGAASDSPFHVPHGATHSGRVVASRSRRRVSHHPLAVGRRATETATVESIALLLRCLAHRCRRTDDNRR